MFNLTVYRKTAESLTDLLQYAVMLDEHTILNKNGSLITCIEYAGKDVDSSTVEELNVNSSVNQMAMSILGSGWCSFHDLCRRESSDYMPFTELDDFPDKASRLIEQERRSRVAEAGSTYENTYVLTLCWMPESVNVGKAKDLMYTTSEDEVVDGIAERNLGHFKSTVENLKDRLSQILDMRSLGNYEVNHVTDQGVVVQTNNEMLEHLDYCVSGNTTQFALPENTMYLDSVIGGHDFTPGIVPIVGDKYVTTVVIDGFPISSWAQILSGLDALPFEYRWSNRFIYLDEHEAIGEINKFRRKWAQKERGFKDQLSQKGDGRTNRHATNMVDDIDDAFAEVSSGIVYGYYTSTMVLTHSDPNILDSYAKEVVKVFSGGFNGRHEKLNCVEAYMGSLPGHVDENVRRPIISTVHLSNLLPLAGIWSGGLTNENNLYPENSPMLMQCETTGHTPFRFSMHVNDVGHMLCLGVTGSGKSVFLQSLIAQTRRYKNSKVFAFDKGYSGYALCKAMGGTHYDVGHDDQSVFFCPLADIHIPSELSWAMEWIEICCDIEGLKFTPEHRNATFEALKNLVESDRRSLTEFSASVQNKEIRSAMQGYLIDGRYKELLDAETNTMKFSAVNVFEIKSLMDLGKAKLPTLLYILRQIKRSATGDPGFLFIDEAWVALADPSFCDRIEEFLREMRKDNFAVALFTQSPQSIVDSTIGNVIIDQCMTKVFLPNPHALDKAQYDIYSKHLGLNDRQINLIATSRQKRDYYYTSDNGNRIFSLTLGAKTLALCGVAGEEAKQEIDRLIQLHGEEKWLERYLAKF